MSSEVLLTCALIIIARIADVSLGTLRTVFIVYGRKLTSLAIGFVEILIWIMVVTKVVDDLAENPAYGICYALGFALGTYIGIAMEQQLSMGEQVVRIFTRKGEEMAIRFRGEGFGVTSFDGTGRDGPIQLLFIQAPRRKTARIAALAREFDSQCFYVVDDVRAIHPLRPSPQLFTGWRAVMKRK
jgi:uncharacterized protein YebE (UPF0316 family)